MNNYKLLLCLVAFYGCGKYPCECTTLRKSPGGNNAYSVSSQQVNGPKFQAEKTCKSFSDTKTSTTCVLK